MADEFIRPSGDTTLDGWTDEADGTTTIYTKIDESTAGDSDFVQSPVIDAAQADLKVRLLQGSTQIAEWTHSDVSTTFTDAAQTLTSPQLAAISDFNDLNIELDDNAGSVYKFALGNPTGALTTPVVVRYRYAKLVDSGPPGWVLTDFDFDLDFVNNRYWDGTDEVALSTLLTTSTSYSLSAGGLSVTSAENHAFTGAALTVLNTIAAAAGTIYLEFNIPEGPTGYLLDFGGLSGNRPICYIAAPGPPTTRVSYYDGTNAPAGPIVTPSTNVRLALGWSGSTISASVNGAAAVSNSWDGNWDASSPTLGEGLGGVWPGYIRRVAGKTTRLSDAELATVTT